jgi:hypothetical protein
MGGSLTKLWAWPFVVLLRLALLSCHLDETARADVPELGLNEPFPLPIPFGDYRAASVVQKR